MNKHPTETQRPGPRVRGDVPGNARRHERKIELLRADIPEIRGDIRLMREDIGHLTETVQKVVGVVDSPEQRIQTLEAAQGDGRKP